MSSTVSTITPKILADTQAFLEAVKARPSLNAFLELFEEEALNQASTIQAKMEVGGAGRLAGKIIGLKDVLCYANHGLQSSSKILDGFKSQFTGTAVQRLVNEDAVILGRQNCDEFAMGSSNESSAFGPAKNAIDEERVPGGSSGGSAAAVQAGLCHASIGSDTGGSVRQPAAFCGVVGLKPTYSRVSRYGLVAYGSSFDCIGPITNNVDDAALLLEIMAGADDFDSTVSQQPVQPYSTMLDEPKGLKIAVYQEGFSDAIQPDVKKNLEDTVAFLKSKGHSVTEISFKKLDYLLPTYYILTMAEASSNLSRFDGVRYGYRSPNATTLESMYKLTRSEGFGPEVQRRIMLGTFVLSASYYDAYFTKAQRVRRLIKVETDKLLDQFDLILTPTAPTTAYKIGEKSKDPLSMYLGDVFTVQANVAGIPAISVPTGVDKNGLPIGMQFMAGGFKEAQLLAAAKHLMEGMAK